MSWTALLPFKPPADRKTRLAGLLDPDQRIALSMLLFESVVRTLGECPAIGAIHLLAAAPPAGWQGGWHADRGRGLNAELEAARAAIGPHPLLVLHADLPLLAVPDVETLLDAAARAGRAIAPDRHGAGTNALALHDRRSLRFRFGPESFALHRAQGPAAIVARPGLALDIDSPADLAEAIGAGFTWRQTGSAGTN
jgi:2-phospho-L-lactate guanylyltransferase